MLQKKIVNAALMGIAKWITSPEAWDVVRNQVQALAGAANMTGEEKRAALIAAVKEAGWRWANWALNLLIEIAVVVVTDRLAQEAGDSHAGA